MRVFTVNAGKRIKLTLSYKPKTVENKARSLEKEIICLSDTWWDNGPKDDGNDGVDSRYDNILVALQKALKQYEKLRMSSSGSLSSLK